MDSTINDYVLNDILFTANLYKSVERRRVHAILQEQTEDIEFEEVENLAITNGDTTSVELDTSWIKDYAKMTSNERKKYKKSNA